MKVILRIEEPSDMRHAAKVLDAAINDADLGSCGFLFIDGKRGFYLRRKSGTIVIHIQAKPGEAS